MKVPVPIMVISQRLSIQTLNKINIETITINKKAKILLTNKIQIEYIHNFSVFLLHKQKEV